MPSATVTARFLPSEAPRSARRDRDREQRARGPALGGVLFAAGASLIDVAVVGAATGGLVAGIAGISGTGATVGAAGLVLLVAVPLVTLAHCRHGSGR